MSRMDYSRPETPAWYKCAQCGATGCKLWCETPTGDKILCAKCAAADQHKDISDIDGHGRSCWGTLSYRTNTIGWFMPAIPAGGEHEGFWASGPDYARAWWDRLPTLPRVITSNTKS